MTTFNNPVIASYEGNGIDIHPIKDVIAVDMDDTLVDLNKEWIKLYNERTGKSRVVADITHYNFSNCEGFDASIYDDLRTKGLFINLKPMRDALDVIYRLSEQYTVIFLTYAVHGSIANEKYDWILNNVTLSKKNALGSTVTDHIITCRNKTFVRADILIDDAAHHAKSHKLVYGSTCIGVKCPWNASHANEFDFLAEEDNQESAWLKMERFIKEREIKIQELLAVGKRFNSEKSAWDLLPKHAVDRCFDLRNGIPDVSKVSLLAEMVIWYTAHDFDPTSAQNVLSLTDLATKALILAGGKEGYSFYKGLDLVAKVMTFGCKKYDARNWEKGLFNESTFGSAMRHLCADETIDSESNLPHVAHAAWNCLIMLEMVLRAIENPEYYMKFVSRYDWRNSNVYGYK